MISISFTKSGSRRVLMFTGLGLLTACAQTGTNFDGMTPTELARGRIEGPSGIGIEGRDIVRISGEIVSDLLANPIFANAVRPPQVIVDAQHFRNLSAQRLNLNLFTDRIRVEMNRTARGRIVFISRENSAMVEDERGMRRAGRVDVGTRGMTRAQAGADYRLTGRINTEETLNGASGVQRRFTQVVFEMVDMERGMVAWSDIKEFERAAAQPVMYR